jgi:hypothetical protein
MDNQPSLLDALAAIQATNEAIERVEQNTDPNWAHDAQRAISYLARSRPEFTTDDVWEFLHRHGVNAPHEPRALGALMRNAARAGLIKPTDRVRPSDRPECHRNPKRVWRSL